MIEPWNSGTAYTPDLAMSLLYYDIYIGTMILIYTSIIYYMFSSSKINNAKLTKKN